MHYLQIIESLQNANKFEIFQIFSELKYQIDRLQHGEGGVNELTQLLSESLRENQDLVQECSFYKEKLQHYEATQKKTEEELYKISTHASNLQSNLHQTQFQIQELEEEQQGSLSDNFKVTMLVKENKMLQVQLAEFESKLQAYAQQIEELQKENQRIQIQQDQDVNQSEHLHNLKKEIISLQQQIQNERVCKMELEVQLRSSYKECDTLQFKNQQLLNQIEILNIDLENYKLQGIIQDDEENSKAQIISKQVQKLQEKDQIIRQQQNQIEKKVQKQIQLKTGKTQLMRKALGNKTVDYKDKLSKILDSSASSSQIRDSFKKHNAQRQKLQTFNQFNYPDRQSLTLTTFTSSDRGKIQQFFQDTTQNEESSRRKSIDSEISLLNQSLKKFKDQLSSSTSKSRQTYIKVSKQYTPSNIGLKNSKCLIQK